MTKTPFWHAMKPAEMSHDEWESLCDGCGRCCLAKLEDEDDGSVLYTNIACRLLDPDTCRCTDYARRTERVPECLAIRPDTLERVAPWLPSTCAYRRLAEGKPLPDWHPLVSGDTDSVVRAGVSVRGRVVPEAEADAPELHLVTWVS